MVYRTKMQSANPIIKNILGELIKLKISRADLSKIFEILFKNCPGLKNIDEKQKYVWLAGLIDGEGCIALYKQYSYKIFYEKENNEFRRSIKRNENKYNYYCLLRITNSFFELIVMLLKYFGGKVVVIPSYRYNNFYFQWRPENQDHLEKILQNVYPKSKQN